MSLNEMLRELVSGCDALGAVILDDDGISVDEHRTDDLFDLQGAAVEYVSVIRETRHAVGVLESGDLEELTVMSDQLMVLVRPIVDDLFLLVVLRGDACYGKARYLMKRDLHHYQEMLR